MMYICLAVIVILLTTLSPKYLGVFKCISLGNIISNSMVMNVRYSIIIAFVLWLLYTHIQRFKEGYENATTAYANSQNNLAGNDTSAPDSYNYTTSTNTLDEEQHAKLCAADSDLTDEQRKTLCDSDVASLNISPGGAMDTWKDKMENLNGDSKDTKMQPSPLYTEPGTVKYGGMGYKPSYEQAAYNNNFKFETQPNPIENSSAQNEGFCKDSDMFGNIEEKCNSLSKDVCATTSCCVLIGGEKCVHGNENGPQQKRVYSDSSIKNRDVYYYRGKCYGNCK